MQKKLLGAAVAVAFAAPGAVFAQAAGTGLQIYGVIETLPMHQKFDGGPAGTNKSDVVMHMIAPRLGFRGREALGGGLSAWFQAEMGISSTGRPNVANPNGVNWLGGRNTGVGLDGGFGTVMVGIWDSPYKLAGLSTWNLGTFGLMSHYGIIMNNGDTTGTGPSNVGAAVGTLTEGNAHSFGRRTSNTLQYWTPNFGGFQGRISTTLDGSKTIDSVSPRNDPAYWDVSLVYSSGPLTIGGAFARHEGFRDLGTVGSNSDVKDEGWQIGAKYTFGAFAIGAGYEVLEYGDQGPGTDFELKNWVINATFNIGAGQIFAGYSQTDGMESCGAALSATGLCGSATEADMISVGYAHNLSKRTKVYVSYSQIDNGFNAGATGTNGQSVALANGSSYYYVAGPQGNNGSGAASGLVAGSDVRSIGVGIQHSF